MRGYKDERKVLQLGRKAAENQLLSQNIKTHNVLESWKFKVFPFQEMNGKKRKQWRLHFRASLVDLDYGIIFPEPFKYFQRFSNLIFSFSNFSRYCSKSVSQIVSFKESLVDLNYSIIFPQQFERANNFWQLDFKDFPSLQCSFFFFKFLQLKSFLFLKKE